MLTYVVISTGFEASSDFFCGIISQYRSVAQRESGSGRKQRALPVIRNEHYLAGLALRSYMVRSCTPAMASDPLTICSSAGSTTAWSLHASEGKHITDQQTKIDLQGCKCEEREAKQIVSVPYKLSSCYAVQNEPAGSTRHPPVHYSRDLG